MPRTKHNQNLAIPQKPDATSQRTAAECWHFANGTCRFGAHCRFAHSLSDPQTGASSPAQAASEADSRIQELLAELAGAIEKAKHGELMSELESIKLDLSTVEAQKAELRQKLDEQESMTKATEADRAVLAKRHTDELTAVRVEKDELQKQVGDLTERIHEQESRTKAAEDARAWLAKKLYDELTAVRAENGELQKQVSDLTERIHDLAEQGQSPAGSSQDCFHGASNGAEWHFESAPNEWSGFPLDRNAELQKRFEEFSKGGKPEVCMKSGVEEYKFDFAAMLQTNIRTGKTRAIKCTFRTPGHWTRCVDLHSIFRLKPAETVKFSGFRLEYCNTTFAKSVLDKVNGHAVWWSNTGDVLLYFHKNGTQMFMLPVTSLYNEHLDKIQGGINSFAIRACCNAHPRDASKWEEFNGVKVTEVLPAPLIVSPAPPGVLPLMEVAVELWDSPSFEKVARLLRDSVAHSTPHHGASACDDFKGAFKLVRLLRVENWHLWTKYQNHVQQVKRDLLKYGITLGAFEPRLPDALITFPQEYGGVDAAVAESVLFHGTSFSTAAKIALEGFDFRLSNRGYYGQGTYFASQACKSHQYAQQQEGLRTIIVSRVVVGDVSYSEKVDPECRRPPTREGTLRCCDSVVARPGPMPGHKDGVQTHQEFVVFDKYQAYPEFIVQYTCEA